MAPRRPETLEEFIARLHQALESGQTQIRFGQHHHSHAVCVEDGTYCLRRLEHTAEEARAYLDEHGIFMPEHAEMISSPRKLVFEAASLEAFTEKLERWWPWDRGGSEGGSGGGPGGSSGGSPLRYLAHALGVMILGAVLLGLLHLDGLGFPDGHLTELDRCHRRIGYVILAIGALWALYHFYLGWSAGRRRIGRTILRIVLADAFLFAMLIAADRIMRTLLDHGQGG